MAKSQRLHAFSWLGVILSIIALSVFGFIGAKSTLDYNYCKELQTAIDKGIIVEAEIVALVHTSGGKNSGSIYNIMYRYTDQDGIVYESYCGRGNYETEAEENSSKRFFTTYPFLERIESLLSFSNLMILLRAKNVKQTFHVLLSYNLPVAILM